MKYPDAAKGIRKIYLAEILSIIGVVIAVAMMVIMAANHFDFNTGGDELSHALESSGMMIPFALYLIGIIVFFLVSMVLILAGLVQGAHDEESFRRALWAALAGVAVSIAAVFLKNNNPGVSNWLNVASTVCTMTVTLLVLAGIEKIADSIGNRNVAEQSRSCSRMVLYPFILSVVLEVIVALLDLNETATTLCTIAISVLDVAAYLFYVRVLSKARVMQ